MKHVIVIETSDDKPLSKSQREDFIDDICYWVENAAKTSGIGYFIRTSFFQPSAVNAVCEMYGNDYRVGQEKL
jgi:hypothetical protein